MFKDFVDAIENADNPQEMANLLVATLVLYVIIKLIQVVANVVTGFFRNDKTQFAFMRDLLDENIQTRRELSDSNKELSRTNRELARITQATGAHIQESTAAMTYLYQTVHGIKSTTDDAYALTQVIHQSGEQAYQLLQQNVTKLDDLIQNIQHHHQDQQSSEIQTQRLLQTVMQRQAWLHLRLLSDYPQLALPSPVSETQSQSKEKTHVNKSTTSQSRTASHHTVTAPTSRLGAA